MDRAKKARKKNGRKAGKAQISISLPQGLVDRIDKLADAQNRNRSNFISTALSNMADEK